MPPAHCQDSRAASTSSSTLTSSTHTGQFPSAANLLGGFLCIADPAGSPVWRELWTRLQPSIVLPATGKT